MLSICEFNDLACNYFMAAVLVAVPPMLLLLRALVRRLRGRTPQSEKSRSKANSPPDWPW